MPVAPGTFGTLACLLLIIVAKPPLMAHAAFALVAILIGVPAASAAEASLNEKDSSRIIIDEFAGYAVATLGLPPSPQVLFASFCLFRFLDIFKPLGIRRLESSFRGGAGVMADDILAGIYTNLAIRLGLRMLGGP